MVDRESSATFAIAEFDFTATDADEISFHAGDIIRVIAKHNDDWWEGEVNGRIGVFPVNRCTETTDVEQYVAAVGMPDERHKLSGKMRMDLTRSFQEDAGSELTQGIDVKTPNSGDVEPEGDSPTRRAGSGTAGVPSANAAWQQAVNTDGQVYYYNLVTNETSWHLPDEQSAPFPSRPSLSQTVFSEAPTASKQPATEEEPQTHNGVPDSPSIETTYAEADPIPLPTRASPVRQRQHQQQNNPHISPSVSSVGPPIRAPSPAAIPALQKETHDKHPHPLFIPPAAIAADTGTGNHLPLIATVTDQDSDAGVEDEEGLDIVTMSLKSAVEVEDEETADSNPAGAFIAFDEEERANFDSVPADWIKREGLLNRKLNRLAGGVPSSKGWKMLFAAGGGGFLVFYKEKASRARKTDKPTRPVSCFDLQSVEIELTSKQHTKKKHSFVLNAPSGEQMFLQAESEHSMASWMELIRHEQKRQFADADSAIRAVISNIRKRQMEPISPKTRRRLRVKSFSSHGMLLNEGKEKEKEEEKKSKARSFRSNSNTGQNSSPSPSFSADPPHEDISTDKQKVKSKLGRFFSSRPTVDSLKDKGILKQNLLFGGKLENAGRAVPSVVEKCIDVVNRKGLDSVGIYRLSGNAAAIQKIRFRLNHEEDVNFDDEPDINVVTGTLKLYFRELADPLMTFAYYEPLIEAAKIGEYDDRLMAIKDLVHALPLANFATLKYLCEHLTRVAAHSEVNKMEASNLAIVFGPTLIRPMEETFKTICNTGLQNSIIENLILQCDWIFKKVA